MNIDDDVQVPSGQNIGPEVRAPDLHAACSMSNTLLCLKLRTLFSNDLVATALIEWVCDTVLNRSSATRFFVLRTIRKAPSLVFSE